MTLLHQRKGKGIWQNLWEFPLLESRKEIDLKEINRLLSKIIRFDDSTNRVYQHSENVIIHKLSHQHLHTKFWIVETSTVLEEGIALTNLTDYPVPVLIADFIDTLKNSYF